MSPGDPVAVHWHKPAGGLTRAKHVVTRGVLAAVGAQGVDVRDDPYDRARILNIPWELISKVRVIT